MYSFCVRVLSMQIDTWPNRWVYHFRMWWYLGLSYEREGSRICPRTHWPNDPGGNWHWNARYDYQRRSPCYPRYWRGQYDCYGSGLATSFTKPLKPSNGDAPSGPTENHGIIFGWAHKGRKPSKTLMNSRLTVSTRIRFERCMHLTSQTQRWTCRYVCISTKN